MDGSLIEGLGVMEDQSQEGELGKTTGGTLLVGTSKKWSCEKSL